jgi:hypothetical protein
MKKRGELIIDNVVEMMLAAGVVFLLVVLFVKLFSPTYDVRDDVAKSYFDSFKIAIDEANSFGKSSFFILNDGESKTEFYLVYFGERVNFLRNDREFIHTKKGENDICVCYLREDFVVCDHCMDLGKRVEYVSVDNSKNIVEWVMDEGSRVDIVNSEVDYVFIQK